MELSFREDPAEPGKYSISLNEHLTVVVLRPCDGYVVVGFFWDGQLVHLVDQPTGTA